MQVLVGRVAASGLERVTSRGIGGVAYAPLLTARPKRGHPPLFALWIAENHVQFDLVEWILVRLGGDEDPFGRFARRAEAVAPGLRRSRGRGRAQQQTASRELHKTTRSSPSRRVTRSRSRYSSSGMAYLREMPVQSLNVPTLNRTAWRAASIVRSFSMAV